jgi:hypothetical protein
MARGYLTAVCLFVTIPAEAFQTPGPGKAKRPSATSEPKLPGAVARPPSGIGLGAPFDVAAYFAAPPLDLNAAPLYLDALFEFDPGMAVCSPEVAETTRRKQIATRKMKALRDQYQAITGDSGSVDRVAIDQIVADIASMTDRSTREFPRSSRRAFLRWLRAKLEPRFKFEPRNV